MMLVTDETAAWQGADQWPLTMGVFPTSAVTSSAMPAGFAGAASLDCAAAGGAWLTWATPHTCSCLHCCCLLLGLLLSAFLPLHTVHLLLLLAARAVDCCCKRRCVAAGAYKHSKQVGHGRDSRSMVSVTESHGQHMASGIVHREKYVIICAFAKCNWAPATVVSATSSPSSQTILNSSDLTIQMLLSYVDCLQ